MAREIWHITLASDGDTPSILNLLNAAPGSDTGQVAIPVRIISSLAAGGGGGGGGVATQGARDASVQNWFNELRTAAGVSYDARDRNWTITETVPVSGTFWQATQPVSGTFWQATQPVSGTVAVSNFPASQAVTGTFWQATQPVSGTFWQATQPVSGTFWQATQPVSGSVTADTELPAAAALTDADPSGPTVPTVGAFVMLHDGNAGLAKRAKAIFNTMNTNASGVLAAGLVGQFDDVTPGALTENNFGPVRMSSRREVYTTIRDAAGNERGVNVGASGELTIKPRTINTFTALYRLALAAASSGLSFLTVANTDKQIATIFHAGTATKTCRIRRVWVEIISNSAASEVQLELRRLTSATTPATGNPAITPINRNPGGAAVEATCLALPTTAGTDFNANAPIASRILNLGISSAQTAPPLLPSTVVLFDEASADDEEEAPTMRAANAEGYAVVLRATAATTIKFIVRMVFTEE
jgi:hypothetical protein